MVSYVNDLSIKGHKMCLYQTFFLNWIHVSNNNVSNSAVLWAILWLVVQVVASSSRYDIDVFFFILVQIWDWCQKTFFVALFELNFIFVMCGRHHLSIRCCNYFVNNFYDFNSTMVLYFLFRLYGYGWKWIDGLFMDVVGNEQVNVMASKCKEH